MQKKDKTKIQSQKIQNKHHFQGRRISKKRGNFSVDANIDKFRFNQNKKINEISKRRGGNNLRIVNKNHIGSNLKKSSFISKAVKSERTMVTNGTKRNFSKK